VHGPRCVDIEGRGLLQLVTAERRDFDVAAA
jgi:hypothetical protein